jgi:predicted SAM-dependent methyltransferase
MNPRPDSILDDIDTMFAQGDINLNLGCGSIKLENCINCDLYNDQADRKIDATDLSEFEDGSVNAIYASQLLEHFTFAEAVKMIREWRRALRHKGFVMISVPDMEEIIEVLFNWQPRPANVWESMMKFVYGWQEEVGEGQIHKWGYSAEYLMEFLKKMGFRVTRVYRGYPRRPTPSIMVISVVLYTIDSLIKWEEREDLILFIIITEAEDRLPLPRG